MPPAKTKDKGPGLGRAIINRQVKDAKRMAESSNYAVDPDAPSNLKSVTQEADLDEFFNTAQLAETDFTAERRNVKIIPQSAAPTHNAFLLSAEEEKSTLLKHKENKNRLLVPRRPPWTKKMTAVELDRQEKLSFLDWRRGIAQLQDNDHLLLTPFERNIEVWRQLWRVLERSHLVVQIVDARNPLTFRCDDLETYVADLEGSEGEQGTGPGKRRNLLLINKADLLTAKQRSVWADYFEARGIQYAFFSAANAAAIQEARREAAEAFEAQAAAEAGENAESSDEGADDDEEEDSDDDSEHSYDSDDDGSFFSAESEEDLEDPRSHVLSVLELEDLFKSAAPPLSDFVDQSGSAPTALVVGLVGYPNVGKSSTINALIGEKKVSVSATPGKTKHFQTLNLSDEITLCDCPGLVFPQFATTKAALICDGVLPIDQMKEYTGPTGLLVQRIPKEVLEAIYGLAIPVKIVEEGGTGVVTASDLLIAYAVARGYMRAGQGNPDEARAARYILKDYVNAKLLYPHPPPDIPDETFNEETHARSLRRAIGKKRAPTTRVGKNADTFVTALRPITATGSSQVVGHKTNVVDEDFFDSESGLGSKPMMSRGGNEFSRSKLLPHQNRVADDGTGLTGRRARIAAVVASAERGGVGTGKKNHKKPKRAKQRSGKGYE